MNTNKVMATNSAAAALKFTLGERLTTDLKAAVILKVKGRVDFQLTVVCSEMSLVRRSLAKEGKRKAAVTIHRCLDFRQQSRRNGAFTSHIRQLHLDSPRNNNERLYIIFGGLRKTECQGNQGGFASF